MNMNLKVVFDYKGDGLLTLLGANEVTVRNSLERAFVQFHNLYADYVNSSKGYETWNNQWDELGNKAPNTNDEWYAAYNKFIADKGNQAIKEIVNSNYEGNREGLVTLLNMFDFYIEPEECQLHGKLIGTGIDISLHLEEIK